MSELADPGQGLLWLKTFALKPVYSWGVSQRLKQFSWDVLLVSDCSLYPAFAQTGARVMDHR